DRKRPLPHLLLCGPPNMGKRRLACAVARELARNALAVEGAERVPHPSALAAILATRLGEHEPFVLEDVDTLRPTVAKVLARALAEQASEVVTGEGAFASTVDIPLLPFTLIATTSRPSQVDRRLRPWFVRYDLVPYDAEQIARIL